ncbi:hypothetical protein PAHAL_5G345600 [Panicum hallii]|jgi:hypothetical protein|uniref:Uncharacterized protein n=1 Tax=Panicum hallii TaxID=206008 RepID=A0A2T8IMA6_9POAL|nr:hypothetical protein PAHAL_5G345600 [Panicum hallii]
MNCHFREGPVRVKLNGRNVNSLRGVLEIFINKVGYEMRFVAKAIKDIPASRRSSPRTRVDMDSSEEDEEDLNKESEHEWDNSKELLRMVHKGGRTLRENALTRGGKTLLLLLQSLICLEKQFTVFNS